MKVSILSLILFGVYTHTYLYGQVSMTPLCLTCDTKNLPADVYIIPPDGIEGQLISGQFYRIAGVLKTVYVSYEEISCFMESKGKEFIKMGGGAYFMLSQNNKYHLAEIVRKDESHFEPLRITSIDAVINTTPFINIIVPRLDNDIYSTQR